MPATFAFDDLTLETSRLLLRPPRLDDLDAFAAMMTDEETARFLGGTMPRAMTWRGLMTMIGAWHAQGFAMFSVFEKSTGRWVGRLGPWMPEGWPGPEIGWSIVRDCWGRGYAVEGAIATTNWAFDTLGWTRMIHSIAPRERRLAARCAEARVAAARPGNAAGTLRARRGRSRGQTREEWRNRHSG